MCACVFFINFFFVLFCLWQVNSERVRKSIKLQLKNFSCCLLQNLFNYKKYVLEILVFIIVSRKARKFLLNDKIFSENIMIYSDSHWNLGLFTVNSFMSCGMQGHRRKLHCYCLCYTEHCTVLLCGGSVMVTARGFMCDC